MVLDVGAREREREERREIDREKKNRRSRKESVMFLERSAKKSGCVRSIRHSLITRNHFCILTSTRKSASSFSGQVTWNRALAIVKCMSRPRAKNGILLEYAIDLDL